MPRSTPSDLSLHGILRRACLNACGEYGTSFLAVFFFLTKTCFKYLLESPRPRDLYKQAYTKKAIFWYKTYQYTLNGSYTYPAGTWRLWVKYLITGLLDIYYWLKSTCLFRTLLCKIWHLKDTISNTDWWSGGSPGRQHSFVGIDHEIFSTDVILSLPLIQEGYICQFLAKEYAQYWLIA